MFRIAVICLSALPFFSTLAAAAEIHEVAKTGDLGKVQSLLASKPELVHAKDSYGKTPLHWACMGVHKDVIVYLVGQGADVNAGDLNEVTPLHSLALRGHMDGIEFLVGKGADVKARNIMGSQALIYAAAGGHEKAVEFFILKGVDPDEKDRDKGTPLHHAAHQGKKKIVEMLIAKGAAVNARNADELTPADLASDAGHPEIARILFSKGGKPTPVRDAKAIRLADRIFRITFPFSGRPNIGLSVGSDGALLVDTGYRRTSGKLKSKVSKLAKGEIKYLINTHRHFDHNGGNSVAGEKTTVVDFTNLDKMASQGVLKKGVGALEGRSGKKFDTYYTLHFNGEEIRLIPFPGVHTDADLMVHFVESKVVHMGDLLISQSFPSVSPKVSEYLDFLDRAVDVFPENATFISGHGKDLTMKGLRDYRNMLGTTVAIVNQGHKAGKTAETMKKEKLLTEFESYNAFIPFLSTDYWIDAIVRSNQSTR